MTLDLLDNLEASANGSFLLFRLSCLVYPVFGAAIDAIEFITLLAEVSNILEIEFGFAIFAVLSLQGLADKLLVF